MGVGCVFSAFRPTVAHAPQANSASCSSDMSQPGVRFLVLETPPCQGFDAVQPSVCFPTGRGHDLYPEAVSKRTLP